MANQKILTLIGRPVPRGGGSDRSYDPPPQLHKGPPFQAANILHLFQTFRGQSPNSPGVSPLVHISSQTTPPKSELGTGLIGKVVCLQKPLMHGWYYILSWQTATPGTRCRSWLKIKMRSGASWGALLPEQLERNLLTSKISFRDQWKVHTGNEGILD